MSGQQTDKPAADLWDRDAKDLMWDILKRKRGWRISLDELVARAEVVERLNPECVSRNIHDAEDAS